jgi:hypothetical protein
MSFGFLMTHRKFLKVVAVDSLRKPFIGLLLTVSLIVFGIAYASGFSCDNINPKTGRLIVQYREMNHRLSGDRDIITTTEHYRYCKPRSRRPRSSATTHQSRSRR